MNQKQEVSNFDALVDANAARRLLQEGDGQGVRIALLDSGVDVEHQDFQNTRIESLRPVWQGPGYRCVPHEGGDPVGHGTACAGIIHRLAPAAQLVSVQVLGKNSSGTLDQMLAGLAWAIEQPIDIINLSLGTVQRSQIARLHELIDRAYYRGKLVVAAANNHQQVSYPANFASLIAVDSEHFKDPLQFRYHLDLPVEVAANGIYVEAPAPGGGTRWYTGTSFACPHVSGLLARLRSAIPELTPFQAKSLLWVLRDVASGP